MDQKSLRPRPQISPPPPDIFANNSQTTAIFIMYVSGSLFELSPPCTWSGEATWKDISYKTFSRWWRKLFWKLEICAYVLTYKYLVRCQRSNIYFLQKLSLWLFILFVCVHQMADPPAPIWKWIFRRTVSWTWTIRRPSTPTNWAPCRSSYWTSATTTWPLPWIELRKVHNLYSTVRKLHRCWWWRWWWWRRQLYDDNDENYDVDVVDNVTMTTIWSWRQWWFQLNLRKVLLSVFRKYRDSCLFNIYWRWIENQKFRSNILRIDPANFFSPELPPHQLSLRLLYVYCLLKMYWQIRSFNWAL